MRKPNPSIWNDFPQKESLILFAQTILESLFDHSIDSFKAPALNAHSLALEARIIAADIIEGRVQPGALKPVVDELLDKINQCPVFQKTPKGIISAYSSEISKSNSAKEVAPIIDALLGEIEGHYWEAICKYISCYVHNGETDKKIIDLTNTFICEAELIGFAREDVYLHASKFFTKQRPASKKISSPDSVDEFLDHFTKAQKNDFVIEFAGDKSFYEMKETFAKMDVEILSLQDKAQKSTLEKQFLRDGLVTRIIVDKIKALDASKARESAEYRLQFGVDIERFFSHQHSARWNRLGIVKYKGSSRTRLIKPPTQPVLRGAGTRNQFLRIKKEDVIRVFSGESFEVESIRVLYNVLQYHRAALDATTTENQLLDLWAAIEGLIPTPGKDDARISHYCDHILPALTLSYSEKIFSYLDWCIREEIPEAARVIDGATNFDLPFMRTMAVLVCEDLLSERNQIVLMISDNPLLSILTRRAHNTFSSNAAIKKTLSRHKKRVRWHLQRIYSSRNRISHTASRLPYLETLVENLHSYLDILISSVIEVGKNSKPVIGIESALKIISIHEKSYLSDLNGDEIKCTKENFCGFLLGSSSPLSPLSKPFVSPR